MRIRVRHRTVYRYDRLIDYTIQLLRMTPRDHVGQSVLSWRVSIPGRRDPLPVSEDGFGNIVHFHTVNGPHDEIDIDIAGEVETADTHGIVRGSTETLPPIFFLRATPLTKGDEAIADLARDAVSGVREPLDQLHRVMDAVKSRIEYRVGTSDATTKAVDALRAGQGVCQDHAHVFIAAAQSLGYPARYVSGYLCTGEGEASHEASHAWAEAHVKDLAWVGFDPANGVSPTEAYIRTAVGLDYHSAAPVRGLRRGLASEALHVEVRIAAGPADQ